MQMLDDEDKVGRVVECYLAILALGNPGYDLRRILLQSDYFDLPTPSTGEQERIKDAIAIIGQYVASQFTETEKVELNREIKRLLGEEHIRLEDVRFDRACFRAKWRVNDRLSYLSNVDCHEFLSSLEELLTREVDPKFQPIEIYLFGPFAGARPLPNSNLNIAIVSDAFAEVSQGQRKSLIQQLTNNVARLAVIGITFEEAENKYVLGDRKLLLISRHWPGYAVRWEVFPEKSIAASRA